MRLAKDEDMHLPLKCQNNKNHCSSFSKYELHFLKIRGNQEDSHEYPLCILFCLHKHIPVSILYFDSEGTHDSRERHHSINR